MSTPNTDRPKRKRANGEGTFHIDAKGRHVGRLMINGKRITVRAKTLLDARAELNRRSVDIERGVVRADGNATVQPLLDYWASRVMPNKRVRGRELSPSSRENYEMALRVLSAEFGKVRVVKLDGDRVDAGLDRIATGAHGKGKPLGRRSMKLYRETFVQVLDSAVHRGKAPTNPARYAELPVTTATIRARQALSAADVLKLWTACDGARLGPVFRLMMATSMRPGEAFGLCWDSIDTDTGELTLRRAVRRERGLPVLVEQLKTRSAERSLIVPAPALDAIKVQKARVAELKLAASSWADMPGDGLVFPTTNGTPWDPANARGELVALCKVADIPVVSPNELRHTAKALLDEEHIDPVVIRNLMGHSTEWMQDTYGNRSRRAESGHVAVMERIFGGAS